MTREIDILVVEPGKAPRPAKVEDTLEAFQQIVGGPIEAGCFLPQRVMLIHRENGKKLGLPPNRAIPGEKDYIAGTFLLCGFGENSFMSLAPAQQMEFETCFAKPDEFMQIGSSVLCFSPGELSDAARSLWESMGNGESVVLTKWGGARAGVSRMKQLLHRLLVPP